MIADAQTAYEALAAPQQIKPTELGPACQMLTGVLVVLLVIEGWLPAKTMCRVMMSYS